MINFALLLFLAIVAGVAIILQAQFMGLMDQGIGTIESVFITYGGGGLLVGLVILVMRGGNLRAWQAVPWYALLAGLAGLIIVGTIGYTTPRLGLVPTFTILVAVQFSLSALVDHYGLLGAAVRPLDWIKAAGMALMFVGSWLVIR